MTTSNKYTFRKIFVTVIWIMIGAGTVVLLVAAISKRNNERCAKIDISITGVQNNFFIDKKDVLAILVNTNGGILEKKPLHDIDIATMENELKKSEWINNAELFFDNNNVLQVRITEREPIARVFMQSGKSFYIDSSLMRLPLSDKFSARLPVFTSFPTDAIVLSKEDSVLIEKIRTLSSFISANPFWMAQIEQVDILPNREFDLIPKLGNTVVHFGNADNCAQKFNNLLCFYKQVLSKIGWNHYSSIDAQFKGQIVGVKKGANEIKMDSLRSIQIMKAIIADAQKSTNDSTTIQLDQPAEDNSSINSSKETDITPDKNENIKDDIKKGSVTPIHVPEKPTSNNENSLKKNALTSHSSSVEKPNPAPLKSKVPKPPIIQDQNKKIPKAVMPAKTDY